MMRKRKTVKWFTSGKPLNWTKDDSRNARRAAALKARRGNYLAAARALNSLANVTQDKETEKKARADAKYFFTMHDKLQK